MPIPNSLFNLINMQGYSLGIFVSTIAFVLACLYLLRESLPGIISFGGSGSLTRLKLRSVFAAYLTITIIMAFVSKQIFDCNPVKAFLLNISPPALLIFLIYILNLGGFKLARRSVVRSAQAGIADASYIYLQDPFVKKVQIGSGHVILFLHIPFTVTETVQAKSLRFLTPTILSKGGVRFSINPNPHCNIITFEEPSHSFHIVSREYTESPIPFNLSGPVTDAKLLEPNKYYYLLRLLHFESTNCKTSEYEDFDPKVLNITLNTERAKQIIQDNSKV
jgi:hypothetical protein